MTPTMTGDQSPPAARYSINDFKAGLGLVEAPERAKTRKSSRTKSQQMPSSGAIATGSRNVTLTRIAGSARRLGADKAGLAAILEAANAGLCNPPLETDEVHRIADSVEQYEPGDMGAVLSYLTDAANAERLAGSYKDVIRYVPEWKTWIIWEDTRWQIDNTGQIIEFAKYTARRIHEEAAKQVDPAAQDKVTKHALKSQQIERLQAMVKLARSIPELVVRPEDLDKDPMLLGVRNGVIDLRTAQLRQAVPEDYITKQCPVAFDPAAICPVFEEFLEDVTNDEPESAAYMQRIMGYSLSGSTAEQCLFFLHGSGSNGKTTFLNVVKDVLGPDYCLQTPSDTLMVKKGDRGASNDLARLKGVRVSVSNEVEEGSRLSEALIKQMTGSDVVSARFLFKEFFDYTPQFKVWIAGNHQPVIRGTDDGIWRRLHLVPFSATFSAESKDKEMPEKLRAELPGILNFMIRGCQQWQKIGLNPPRTILDAGAEYKAEMDILGQWVEENCVKGADCRVKMSDAYINYKCWAMNGGFQQLSSSALGRRMKERFRKTASSKGPWYHGLRLKTPAEL